jgi:hypothetical protein
VDFPEGRLNLYLTEMGEPIEGGIRLVVTEAGLGAPEKFQIGGVDLGEGRPIVVTDASRSFEITWDDYVAYAVRDESYWMAEANEVFLSHFQRRFDSAFLHYVSTTTFANDSYPGPLQHWGLTTLDHCVDVASVGNPRVRLIEVAGS